MNETADDRVVTEPAARLGLPGLQRIEPALGNDPRLTNQLGVVLQNQVCQGSPTQVARTDALPAVTAGQRYAAGAITQHVGLETPGHAQIAAPAMGDPYVLELREQLAEQIAPQFDLATGQVEVMAQPASKLVPAPSAKNQPIVGRALAVGDLTAAFTEGLTVTETDLVPRSGRQRFGGDDQALYRQLIAPQRR